MKISAIKIKCEIGNLKRTLKIIFGAVFLPCGVSEIRKQC